LTYVEFIERRIYWRHESGTVKDAPNW
jgi:hypothetical protein